MGVNSLVFSIYPLGYLVLLCSGGDSSDLLYCIYTCEFHKMEVYKNILKYYGVISLLYLLLILEWRRNSKFQ